MNATNRATSAANYFSQPLYFSDSFWNNIAPVNDPWQMSWGERLPVLRRSRT